MNKKAQVWIETVIYTGIFLILIGIVLAYAKPKIEETRDKAIIEQSIEILETIDNVILSIVQGGTGNRRVIDIGINKGQIEINSQEDYISFEIDSRYKYTEPGKEVEIGRLTAITEEKGNYNKVKLIRNYENYNITYNNEDKNKIIGKASTLYKIYITNIGDENGIPVIDIIAK